MNPTQVKGLRLPSRANGSFPLKVDKKLKKKGKFIVRLGTLGQVIKGIEITSLTHSR